MQTKLEVVSFQFQSYGKFICFYENISNRNCWTILKPSAVYAKEVGGFTIWQSQLLIRPPSKFFKNSDQNSQEKNIGFILQFQSLFRYRESDPKSRNWLELPINPPDARKVKIHNLTPRTKYEFQVIGENEFGDGMYSAIIEAQTKGKYFDNKKSKKTISHTISLLKSTFCQDITPPIQLLLLKSVQFEWFFGRKWASICIDMVPKIVFTLPVYNRLKQFRKDHSLFSCTCLKKEC